MKEKGKTIIAITHDDRYFHIADKVIHMEYGKIIKQWHPETEKTDDSFLFTIPKKIEKKISSPKPVFQEDRGFEKTDKPGKQDKKDVEKRLFRQICAFSQKRNQAQSSAIKPLAPPRRAILV